MLNNKKVRTQMGSKKSLHSLRQGSKKSLADQLSRQYQVESYDLNTNNMSMELSQTQSR